MFKSTSPIKLYLLEKIHQIETLDQFVEFKTKNLIRSNIRLKVAEAKRNELLTYINNLKIIVPNFEKDVLIKISCKHYNKHKQEIMFEQGEYFEYIPATNDSDMEFLSRICTNFLRHNMSNYEHELSKLFGKVGKNEAYHLLKFKINSAIFAKYDWIKFEEY